jgi:hypothetical protein
VTSRAVAVRCGLGGLAVLVCWLAAGGDGEDWRVLDGTMHHLGDDERPEWSEASPAPEAAPLEITFEARSNPSEWLLELSARDVGDVWALELNGRELARLRRCGDELVRGFYPVPAGFLRDGANRLVVRPVDRPGDDLTVGRARLLERSLREVARLGRVTVRVRDRANGSPLPARVTVVDGRGDALELYYAEGPTTAVRPGIAYTSDGLARLELVEGRAEVWASRGMEWSVARAVVDVVHGTELEVALALEREVDTRGWIAADTHVHTRTFSGHGDASVEERLVTLAGEGVELAIATDHNHQTDYRPLQRALALTPYFTAVVGNEITTENGHMNAFPLDPAAPVPPYEERDWKTLVAGIRARGAEVVILNHPRWPEDGEDPLTKFGFDERTGRNAAGQEFTFDAIELVNSDAPTSPPEVVLPAWYALLEAGQRFTGVGASDSHTVGVVVGQGRTYVPSASDDPAALDLAAAVSAFREGRVSIGLGMFALVEVGGKGMGDTLVGAGERVAVDVDLRHPSWVVPRRLELVVNGVVAARAALDDGAPGDRANQKRRTLAVELPRAGNWIVAVAHGDRVSAPYWPMSLPAAMAITNPVFVER